MTTQTKPDDIPTVLYSMAHGDLLLCAEQDSKGSKQLVVYFRLVKNLHHFPCTLYSVYFPCGKDHSVIVGK